MAFGCTTLNVFIASPGDTDDERNAIEAALHHWNSVRAEREGVVLLPRRWERDAERRLAGPAQAAINTQLLDKADIVLAVLDAKLGTATPDYVSGTAEEIHRAHDAGKPVHVWFSREDIPRHVDPDELSRLQAFETDLRALGVLGDYTTLDELQRAVEDEIERDLERLAIEPPTGSVAASGFPADVVQEVLVGLQDAVDDANNAKAETLVLLSDLLAPVLRQLGRLVRLEQHERPAARERVLGAVLSSRALLFPDIPGVRMVAYRIRHADGHDQLVVDEWAGRPRDEPRSFEGGDGGRGDKALDWLRSGRREPRFTPDTSAETDPDWRGSGRGYLTYVSIPLTIQDEVFGMLTVDAPLPGDLDETDIPVLEVLAQCIAIGYALS